MRLTIEPLPLDDDTLRLVHAWLTDPRAAYWQRQEATVHRIVSEYRALAGRVDHDAWLGRVDGRPAFLVETYDPDRSELAGLPELAPGDLGMHLLLSPPRPPVTGFTRAVFEAVVEHCFADPTVSRVVVEPDVRNGAVLRRNREAGFRVVRKVALEGKTAALSFLSRTEHEDPARHLAPTHLRAAQRHLVAKAIAELSHERLLAPEPDLALAGNHRLERAWVLRAPDGRTTWRFRARRLALEHWLVHEGSLGCWVDDRAVPLDVQALVAAFAEPLGVPDALLPVYLEELAANVASTSWKHAHPGPSAGALLGADRLAVESAMTEGHPGFVAGNGRVGFGLADHGRYAPEAARPLRLVWLAARRAVSRVALGEGLTEQSLWAGELAPDERAAFTERLRTLGLDPDDYLLLPVHPWQWDHKVAVTFAPDLARRDLVRLGEGRDDMRPQQSIRTLANATRPDRHHVKTALAIQNMGFVRGLSPTAATLAPVVNDWVADLVAADPTLVRCGFSVLRERAGVGYTGDAFHAAARGADARAGRASGVGSTYRRMLAALWRESPEDRAGPGERLVTMAALLHRDPHGRSLASAMVAASRLEARVWLRAYLEAYLRPLVHCLAAHDLAFMPHGENLVLVLRDQVPVRAIMKDVGEEVAVLSDRSLPAALEHIRSEVDHDLRALAIHTDVLDGVLRHLAGILVHDGVLGEDDFWQEVADCLGRHADEHPALAKTLARLDLMRPEFRHSCLNRLQLRDAREMVDVTDQASSLLYAGTLANPLAGR